MRSKALWTEEGDFFFKFREFVKQDDIPKLNQENKNTCYQILTVEECAKLLKLLPNNKLPGSDTTNFLKYFLPDIKHIV